MRKPIHTLLTTAIVFCWIIWTLFSKQRRPWKYHSSLSLLSFNHFLTPFGDKKVRKYIHTYAFTRLSHANFLIKLVCDSKHTIPAQKMMMGNSLLNSKVTCVAMELLAKNVRAFRNIKVSIRICKCQKSKTILKQS